MAAELCAVTDVEGAFRILGLKANCSYRICGAGSGLLCEVPEPVTAPKSDSVVLQAQYLYGARIAFETADGEYAKLPDQTGIGQSPVVCDWPAGVLLRRSVVRRTLLGVEPQLLPSDNPSLFLFRSELEPWSPEPVVADLRVNFTGYEPVETSCQLEWLGGDFPEFRCRLTALGAGLGEVLVRFEDQPELGARSADRPQEFGTLKLRNLADPMSIQELSLVLREKEPDGSFRVGGIPYGEYLARLTLANGAFAYPKEPTGVPVAVGPEPAQLSVPTEGLASLIVELIDTDGNPYNGPATFELGEGMPEALPDQNGFRIRGGRGFTKFDRGPYQFPLLPPDHYVVGLSSPTQPFEEERLGPIVVEVLAAGATTVTVRIQRRM